MLAGQNVLLGWHSLVAVEMENGFLLLGFIQGTPPTKHSGHDYVHILVVACNEHQ